MRNILLLYKLLAISMASFLLVSCATLAGVGESGPSPKAEQLSPYDEYVRGKPNIDLRVAGGCYIWRDGNLWHVRIAKRLETPQTLSAIGPIITGKIRVKNAFIADVNRQGLGALNDLRYRQNIIAFRVELPNNNLDNNVSGFDFAVKPTSPEYCVTFNILVDGNKMPGIVHLGSFMHVPDTMPLKICLHSFD
ncbi:MAG: hypothetical protein M0Z67_09535 [Nitrospiraceae bacterium]|nr:hypothetical protein [Nitrospiraceae bacterium]